MDIDLLHVTVIMIQGFTILFSIMASGEPMN